MPKRIAPLTDTKLRNVKPAEKETKLFDGGGLFLLITPRGGRLWHFKYRFGGKEKKLSFGTYPEVSLSDARDKRMEARKQVAAGIDPGEARKAKKTADADKAANNFEVVAREWYVKNEPVWSPGHSVMVMSRLEKDVFPVIGSRPISEIKAPEILKMLQKIEARGVIETAYRIKIVCGQVFRYATATGRAEGDPTAALKGALAKRKVKHHASITDPKEAAVLLRAIDSYQGSFIVKHALCLAPLVFVRPGELRKAEWAEIDLDNAEWNIPAEKMKLKQPHLVPLSRQAIDILRELQPVTGSGKYIFPGRASKPLSENGVNAALRYLGFDKETMTGHGFRAMARTILDEVLLVRIDFIEHQLAHAVKDPNGRAYNRTAHLVERRKMMQLWADYIDGLKAGAKVLPLRKVEGAGSDPHR